MLPAFLIEETEISVSGSGEILDLDRTGNRPSSLLITLGITRVVEQESLDMILRSSPDGVAWVPKPVMTFPQKFYCGTYQLILDLALYPEARYLRPEWVVNRWGRGSLTPMFRIYLFAQSMPGDLLTPENLDRKVAVDETGYRL